MFSGVNPSSVAVVSWSPKRGSPPSGVGYHGVELKGHPPAVADASQSREELVEVAANFTNALVEWQD